MTAPEGATPDATQGAAGPAPEPRAVPRPDGRRFSAAIREEIERRIQTGELAPGERLPTERDLAQSFGVSRSIVRAAVLALVEAGKVHRHVGRGSFVMESPRAEPPGDGALFHVIAPAEMMDVRCILEPGMVDLIMLNASRADLDTIASTVTKGEFSQNAVEWNKADDDFHLALARATHNRLIISLYEAFSLSRKQGAWFRMKQKSVNSNLWQHFQAQHRAISDALSAGDRDAACKAIHEHIEEARANLRGHMRATS